MVDCKEYNNAIRKTKLQFISEARTFTIDPQNPIHLCDEDLMICQHTIPAYALATKTWGLFHVSNLSPIDYNLDAFASLVVPKDVKEILASLVRLQEQKLSQFDDLIAGKGKGLIILLHGLPGVGKTFTAGWTAQYLRHGLNADFHV